MARLTAKDKGVRVNYGKRAKVPHYVKGCKLVQVQEMQGGVLMPLGVSDQATVFPTYRAAERAVKRTLVWFAEVQGIEVGDYEIKQVH